MQQKQNVIKSMILHACKQSMFFFIMFSLVSLKLQAQSLFVRELNNNQSAYSINEIQKITFSSGNLIIKKTSGNTIQHPISDIRYLNFNDLLASISNFELQDNNFKLYPNPVSDLLKISTNFKNDDVLKIVIFDLQGRIYLEKNINASTDVKIDVSTLSKGLYFCTFNYKNNIITKKFIKN